MSELKLFLVVHCELMLKCFNLTHFEIHFKKIKTRNAMEIVVDYEYLEAIIYYGSKMEKDFQEGEYHYVLKCLAHELTHLITGELKAKQKGRAYTFYDERATEHISRLLFRLFNYECQLTRKEKDDNDRPVEAGSD